MTDVTHLTVSGSPGGDRYDSPYSESPCGDDRYDSPYSK